MPNARLPATFEGSRPFDIFANLSKAVPPLSVPSFLLSLKSSARPPPVLGVRVLSGPSLTLLRQPLLQPLVFRVGREFTQSYTDSPLK